jgi:hypothetical protein
MVCQDASALGGSALRGNDFRQIGERPQLRQPGFAGWRERKTGDDGNDPIEFEGSKGARMHWLEPRQCTRWRGPPSAFRIPDSG